MGIVENSSPKLTYNAQTVEVKLLQFP